MINPRTYPCPVLAEWVNIFFSIKSSRGLLFNFAGIGLASMTWLCLSDSGVTLEPPSFTITQALPLSGQTTQDKVLFVNPSVDETIGNGSERAPFKTITQALLVAQPSSVIFLANGTYSTSSGETFPLMLKPGVSIQGDPQTRGQNVVIQGGGNFLSPTFARQNITILGANSSGVTGVTVTNPNPRGYGLWIESSSPVVIANTFTGNNHDGISMTGNSQPTIRSNYFYQNGANGMTIYGTSRPEVRDNVFEMTGFGINIAQKAAPKLIGNRITKNRDGIVAQANARPILRSNVIENNTEDGLVAIATSQPDLGTATEPGGNVFRQNGRYDINSIASSNVIPAFGNQLTNARTSGSIDFGGTRSLVATNTIQPPSNRQVASTLQTMPLTNSSFSASSFPTPSSLIGLGVKPTANSATDGRLTPNPSSILSSRQITSQRTTPVKLPVIPLKPSELSQSVGDSTRATTTMTPIEIPVPPPTPSSDQKKLNFIPITSLSPNQSQDSDRADGNNQTSPMSPSPIPQTESKPLPPPPTQTGSMGQSLPVLEPAPIVVSELLPVPNRNIPIGNTRKQPKVGGTQSSLAPSVRSLSLPSNRPMSLDLHYRVVVEAESESKQALVRSLIPGAFRTFSNGRAMMQVGVFSDRVNADETLQMLTSRGLKGTIEQIN